VQWVGTCSILFHLAAAVVGILDGKSLEAARTGDTAARADQARNPAAYIYMPDPTTRRSRARGRILAMLVFRLARPLPRPPAALAFDSWPYLVRDLCATRLAGPCGGVDDPMKDVNPITDAIRAKAADAVDLLTDLDAVLEHRGDRLAGVGSRRDLTGLL